MKKMLLVVAAAVAVCAVAGPASAQTRFGSNTEAGMAYSFLRDDGENGTLGMVFDVSRQVKGPVSVIGELGLNHFSEFDETMVQAGGGLRLNALSGRRIRPFLQAVIGVQRAYDANGFNVQPGGGANIGLSRRLDARVQVDLPIVRWEGDTYRQFRFGAGLGIVLGRVAD